MSARDLLASFDAWRAEGRDLVLATVYETLGSTYSKAGAQMLIRDDGVFRGMLSGGCLEGDLAERAARVLADDEPAAVTYDLRIDEDDLWGLGVGCDGLMRIFLQPLRAAANWEPFATLAARYLGESASTMALVIESTHAQVAPGTLRFAEAPGDDLAGGVAADAIAAAAGGCGLQRVECESRQVTVLVAPIQPAPRVLVLGGGPDAEPLVRLCAEQGWRVTVQDHRPAYIEKGDFAAAERVSCVPAMQLQEALDLDRFAAVVVMSHHLDTDREYLRQLASSEVPYIGLLGPPGRRARLMDSLGGDGEKLDGRVHGPAGIDIGGRGPASIALSIVAEVHRHLHG